MEEPDNFPAGAKTMGYSVVYGASGFNSATLSRCPLASGPKSPTSKLALRVDMLDRTQTVYDGRSGKTDGVQPADGGNELRIYGMSGGSRE
jgi:hypothetical protein